VTLKDLRGNVPTRINKLRDGQYDAIILASAGIMRLDLDLSDLIEIELDPQEFVPAPAQGVLGLQIREEDHELSEGLKQLNHANVASEIEIERTVLKRLEGGCQLPLGVYCFDGEKGKDVFVSYAPNKDGVGILKSYHSVDMSTITTTILNDLKTL
jgi:hydroxymethylbilane synthase